MYYVYVHKNSATNQPFYVGSGRIGRAYNFYSRPDYWKKYVLINGEPIVEIVASFELKEDSIKKEIEVINQFKRTIDGGILLNKSIGGFGPKGYVQSIEAKNKIGIANKNKKNSAKTKDKIRNSLKNYFRFTESRQKLSERIKNSELFKEKIKQVNYKKRKIILDTQTGIYYNGLEEAASVLNISKTTLAGKLNGNDNNNTSFIYV